MVDAYLAHTVPNWFDVARIAHRQPQDACLDVGLGISVSERPQPTVKATGELRGRFPLRTIEN
jgi:hypothetical protein